METTNKTRLFPSELGANEKQDTVTDKSNSKSDWRAWPDERPMGFLRLLRMEWPLLPAGGPLQGQNLLGKPTPPGHEQASRHSPCRQAHGAQRAQEGLGGAPLSSCPQMHQSSLPSLGAESVKGGIWVHIAMKVPWPLS